MYAPYVDVTSYPLFDISVVPGISAFSLGFVTSDADRDPSWGGYFKVSGEYYEEIINKCRALNIHLICSFGGAAGDELATVIEDVSDLYEAYKQVIERYSFTSIDFDIEGKAMDDLEAHKRRAQAIKMLLVDYPKLKVSVTVAVMPFGLDQKVLEFIKLTPCDLVNVMAMDYGQEKDMHLATINALSAVQKQIKKEIGVTVMIGQNDTPEIFTLRNAKDLKKYIANHCLITRTSIWSIERDAGRKGNVDHSSMVVQKPWAFSRILK